MSPNPVPLYPSSSGFTVKVLDGGLGTTLENSLNISHTPLWSAKAVIEHPDVVLDAHLAFLRAGAQVILTSTYQCSSSTFGNAGYSEKDAREIVSKCVHLAAEARSRFGDERRGGVDLRAISLVPEAPEDVKIALSLGPYGAGLSPAQEFDGHYPPPFGPRGYTPDGENCNAFPKDDEGRRKEDEATAALARFHFERLCFFAEDEAAWDALDFIAFETVPLVREIHAIRMAMADLGDKKSVKPKPWWISFVFPGGEFPETDGDANVPVCSIVLAAVQQDPAGSVTPLPVPSALGINCTEVGVIPGILAEMQDAVLAEFPVAEHRPWLTWVVTETDGVWAEKLGDIVAKIRSPAQSESGRVWPGVVVGGCCRTSPEDIRLLGARL